MKNAVYPTREPAYQHHTAGTVHPDAHEGEMWADGTPRELFLHPAQLYPGNGGLKKGHVEFYEVVRSFLKWDPATGTAVGRASLDRIDKRAGHPHGWASRKRSQMEALGWLEHEKRKDHRGYNAANFYRLAVSAPFREPQPEPATKTEEKSAHRQQTGTGGKARNKDFDFAFDFQVKGITPQQTSDPQKDCGPDHVVRAEQIPTKTAGQAPPPSRAVHAQEPRLPEKAKAARRKQVRKDPEIHDTRPARNERDHIEQRLEATLLVWADNNHPGRCELTARNIFHGCAGHLGIADVADTDDERVAWAEELAGQIASWLRRRQGQGLTIRDKFAAMVGFVDVMVRSGWEPEIEGAA